MTTPIEYGNDYGQSVAIQSDGKIVVAGYDSGVGYNELVRYNSDGSLDPSFGVMGEVTGPDARGYSMVLQSDGKILLAGYGSPSSGVDFALVRDNSNGSLDLSFGGTGMVTTPIGSGGDYGQSVARYKPMARSWWPGTVPMAAIMTLLWCALQQRWLVGCFVWWDRQGHGALGPGDDYGQSVALQADGKIVVAGYSFNGTDNDVAVMRFLSGPPTAPEIAVLGHGVTISYGAAMPNSANGTEFGTVVQGCRGEPHVHGAQ